MSLGRLSRRQLFRRPGRAVLTLLGISCGVASTVGVMMTTASTREAYREMYQTLNGKAALEVVAEGLGGFDLGVVETIRSVTGVALAVPLIQKPIALLGPTGPMAAVTLGVDPTVDRGARDYVIREGEMLDGRDGALLEASLADFLGAKVGEPIRLLSESGTRSVPLVGRLEPKGVAATAAGAVVVVPLSTAQKLFTLVGAVNSIQIVPAEGVAVERLESDLRQAMPAGLTIQEPATRGAMAKESLRSSEQALAALSVVSLVAGAFVILNTFRMNLGERRKQLAILRSIGVTRAQIMKMLLGEAAMLAGIGTALGIALGIGLANVMSQALGALVTMPNTKLTLSPESLIFAVILGPGISLAATYFPARSASRVRPLPELLGVSRVRGDRLKVWPALAGLAIVAVDLVILRGFFSGALPPRYLNGYIAPGMTMFLVGAVLTFPLVLPTLTWVTRRLLSPVVGVEGRLALRQLERQPGRTALTAGVLAIAMIVSIGMGATITNNLDDIESWRKRVLTADFYVRGAMPNLGTLLAPAIPEATEAELKTCEGVDYVDRISFAPIAVGRERALVMARGFSAGCPVSIDLGGIDGETARSKLAVGEVILGTVLSRRLGVKAGDEIELPTRKGPKTVRVAALAKEYTVGGMAIYMDWPIARDLLGFTGVDAYLIFAKPGATDAAQKNVQAVCERHDLQIQSNRSLRDIIDASVDNVVGFLWLLLAITFLVASLGTVNTLTMNVLEQTRELGLLRAVALTKKQLRKMVFAQAIAIGVISMAPGVIAGMFLAYLMSLANAAVNGNPVALEIRLPMLAASALLALGASALAAILPAERAARLNITQALQYE